MNPLKNIHPDPLADHFIVSAQISFPELSYHGPGQFCLQPFNLKLTEFHEKTQEKLAFIDLTTTPGQLYADWTLVKQQISSNAK